MRVDQLWAPIVGQYSMPITTYIAEDKKEVLIKAVPAF
jgi:hypothetical protein